VAHGSHMLLARCPRTEESVACLAFFPVAAIGAMGFGGIMVVGVVVAAFTSIDSDECSHVARTL